MFIPKPLPLLTALLLAVVCEIAAPQAPSLQATGAGKAANSSAPSGVELSVVADAGLNPALAQVARAFEQKTGNRMHVTFTFADSTGLYAQLRSGAAFDAVFSADANQMRKLAASAKVTAPLTEFARDPLMLCISPMVPVEFPPRDPLAGLNNKNISQIAIADPQKAELGKVTVEALTRGRAYEVTVRRKLLIAPDAAQVAQLLESGSADVAILPLTATRAYELRGARLIPLPPSLYRALRMDAAVRAHSAHWRESRELIRFAASAEGAEILRRNGFDVPPSKPNNTRSSP
jgi:molybdate transport system substrate-binding protein